MTLWTSTNIYCTLHKVIQKIHGFLRAKLIRTTRWKLVKKGDFEARKFKTKKLK